MAATWRRCAAPTKLPIVLKGVMRGDDAARAVDAGVAAIWCRTTAGGSSTARRRRSTRCPTWWRRSPGAPRCSSTAACAGAPTCSALALGARAVLLGRPILWGLAVDGEAGVRAVLEIVRAELSRAMALAGCRNVREIGRDLVRANGTLLR